MHSFSSELNTHFISSCLHERRARRNLSTLFQVFSVCNHFFLENAEWVRKDWSILYIFLSFCWRLVLWLKKKGKGNGSNPIEPKKERGRNYNCNLLKSKESCEGRLWTDKLLARGITFTNSAYLAISVTFFFSVLHWDRRNPSALSFCLYFSEVG